MHLGHAYSALLAHDMARTEGGEFLLRIEDIDQSRVRPEWEELIYEDLEWLGLSWEQPVARQSDRMDTYRRVLDDLWDRDALFACTCNRRDILEAASAPHEGAPRFGPDGIVYPGTCRSRRSNLGENPIFQDAALRLDMDYATRSGPQPRPEDQVATFTETGRGPEGQSGTITVRRGEALEQIGDVVLARRDMGTSYHLSVVLDDAEQEITHVVRGQDLFEATRIHVVLQSLLCLPTPVYHHHRLIRDEAGKRLAKRDEARAIRTYREDGASPDDIRRMVGL